MYICSIDIGKKNFAFCVEDVPDKLNDTSEYLMSVFMSGTILILENVDLTRDTSSDIDIYLNMNKLLDSYSDIMDKCQTIIIEQQMFFGKSRNTMALKLAQHCMSYFLCKYGKSKTVIDFPAYHKTQALGAPKILTPKGKYKAMTKPQRKKWSVIKAKEILALRNDTSMLNKLGVKKADDMTDTILQLQAWKAISLYK